ncbi:helix-turn-helix domain-containing protein [Novosphingobium sp. Chol11]|uniref:helix-turn-helix domain-containing protein n=1 Tax=Novosphingobium sp. Chol11 TaxID=1385763 RepID=UPI0025FFC1E8|nr:helix-turn-helix domain-containing protein [Novosphingobium sp. Chol11]
MSDEPKAAGPADGHEIAASDLAATPVARDDAALSYAANAPVPIRLRAAREALGLSLREIAARTRITFRYVEAIEAGDYASLPGRPYALGFARGYARVVGLDESEIADAVRRELETATPRAEPRVFQQFEVGDPAKTPSRLVTWLALALVFGIAAMGLVFWQGYYWPSAELPALVSLEDQRPVAPLAAAQPTPSAPSGTAPFEPVVFTALESGVWVKFYDSTGTQLLQKQLAQGESYTLPELARGPKLWTGRPDALAITIGGQPVPRLATEQKIMKDVPIDAASLRTRLGSLDLRPTAASTSTPTAPYPRAARTSRPRPRAALPSESSSFEEARTPVISESSSTASN